MTMNFDDVIRQRRSIRGYLKKPVPRALIREILELAMRAPTSLNTQPWNFYVVAGAVLDRIRQGNVERNLAGVPDSREFRMGPGYQGVHRERQIGIAKQLFAAMGIERDNKEKRQDWVLRGFRQFDAPVSIVITYDRSIHGSDIAPFDCGGVVNCLVNAAWSRGLGCVINSQGIMQSPVVRAEAGIPDDQVIQTCVAMGWPDDSFPAHAAQVGGRGGGLCRVRRLNRLRRCSLRRCPSLPMLPSARRWTRSSTTRCSTTCLPAGSGRVSGWPRCSCVPSSG
jgi:nitroreductase